MSNPPATTPERDLEEAEYFSLTHHEDGMINHRLTWLLAGQPLLFLAYVTAADPGKLEIDPAKLASPGSTAAGKMLQVASCWIPVAGGVMALGILIGVAGAARALHLLTRRRKRPCGAGVSTFTTVLGLCPPVLIPLSLMVVWFQLWLAAERL